MLHYTRLHGEWALMIKLSDLCEDDPEKLERYIKQIEDKERVRNGNS